MLSKLPYVVVDYKLEAHRAVNGWYLSIRSPVGGSIHISLQSVTLLIR